MSVLIVMTPNAVSKTVPFLTLGRFAHRAVDKPKGWDIMTRCYNPLCEVFYVQTGIISRYVR